MPITPSPSSPALPHARARRVRATLGLFAPLMLVAGQATEAVAAHPIDSLEQVTSWDAISPFTNQPMAPVGLALSPDGDTLYAVTQQLPAVGDGGAELLVFDTADGSIDHSVPLTFANDPTSHGFATSIALSDSGQTAYVTVSKANGTIITAGTDRVEIIDLSPPAGPVRVGRYDTTLANPFGVLDIVFSDDTLYASSRGNHSMVIIDTLTGTVGSVGVGGRPVGLALDPSEDTVWAANRGFVSLVGIDTATHTTTAPLPIPLTGVEVGAFVAITPDGENAYVTSSGSGNIARVELDTMTVVNPTIPTSATCGYLSQIEIGNDGHHAFVSCPDEDQLFVVDVDPASPTYDAVVHTVDVDPIGNFGLLVDDDDGLRIYASSGPNRSISILEPTCPTGGLDSCDDLDGCAALDKPQCKQCVADLMSGWLSQGVLLYTPPGELMNICQ